MFGTEQCPLTGLGSAVDVAACQMLALSDAPSLVWVLQLRVARAEARAPRAVVVSSISLSL